MNNTKPLSASQDAIRIDTEHRVYERLLHHAINLSGDSNRQFLARLHEAVLQTRADLSDATLYKQSPSMSSKLLEAQKQIGHVILDSLERFLNKYQSK